MIWQADCPRWYYCRAGQDIFEQSLDAHGVFSNSLYASAVAAVPDAIERMYFYAPTVDQIATFHDQAWSNGGYSGSLEDWLLPDLSGAGGHTSDMSVNFSNSQYYYYSLSDRAWWRNRCRNTQKLINTTLATPVSLDQAIDQNWMTSGLNYRNYGKTHWTGGVTRLFPFRPATSITMSRRQYSLTFSGMASEPNDDEPVFPTSQLAAIKADFWADNWTEGAITFDPTPRYSETVSIVSSGFGNTIWNVQLRAYWDVFYIYYSGDSKPITARKWLGWKDASLNKPVGNDDLEYRFGWKHVANVNSPNFASWMHDDFDAFEDLTDVIDVPSGSEGTGVQALCICVGPQWGTDDVVTGSRTLPDVAGVPVTGLGRIETPKPLWVSGVLA